MSITHNIAKNLIHHILEAKNVIHPLAKTWKIGCLEVVYG